MYEAIFQKALTSHNPEAILNVAYAFEGLGYHHKANALFQQLRQNVYGIGATRTKRSSSSTSHKHHRHQHQQQQQQDSGSSGGGSSPSGGSGGGSPSPPPNDNSEISDEDVQTDVAFGAMARGTPIKDTNGAVIPPGRYWLDVIGDKAKIFSDWAKSKPEVHIETSEVHTDSGVEILARQFYDPQIHQGLGLKSQDRIFVTFTIPSTSN